MYEILDNGQIVKVEEVKTLTQTTSIKTHYGMARKITFHSDKTQVAVNESITIVIKWEKFDLTQGQYIDEFTNTDDFYLYVAGVQDIVKPVNGQATITFSSAEPGEYIIKTDNPNVDNTEIKVVVTNA